MSSTFTSSESGTRKEYGSSDGSKKRWAVKKFSLSLYFDFSFELKFLTKIENLDFGGSFNKNF